MLKLESEGSKGELDVRLQSKHIAEWTSVMERDGFTKEISPIDDRPQLAELRAKNRAASRPAITH